MTLENQTLIDRAVYTQFQLFRKRYIKSVGFLNYAIYALMLLAAAAVIVLGILKNMFLLILLGILILLFELRILKDNIFTPKKMFEKNKLQNTSVHYIFTKNSFRIPTEDASADVPYIKYSQLIKVYETKTMFYLFLQKNHCYLVAKQGFSAEDAAQFAAHLREILGKKYVVCR